MNMLYGIKNCDTVKKARVWLEAQQIPYQFHDFRTDGLSESQVNDWLNTLGFDQLINKRSTTWKALDDATKTALNGPTAAEVIVAHPTLIKRPLLHTATHLRVGFNATEYQELFQ
jgi:arsenate reductase